MNHRANHAIRSAGGDAGRGAYFPLPRPLPVSFEGPALDGGSCPSRPSPVGARAPAPPFSLASVAIRGRRHTR